MKIAMLILNTSPIIHDARVRKEAQALARAGHIVRLIGLRKPDEPLRTRLDDFDLDLFELKTRNIRWIPFLWLFKYIEFIIKSLVRLMRFHGNVFHAHDLEALIPAWIASKLSRTQVIYDSHELFTERPIEFPQIWRRIERFLLIRVNVVIAASAERAEIMHREYGSPSLPKVLINCPSREYKQSPASIRNILPVEMQSKNLILYQGGLSPNRCLENLTLAAKHFNDNNILIFLGNPTYFSNSILCGLIKANKLEKKVLFVPAVDPSELISFISSADLGVVIYKNNCRNNYYCAPNKLFDYCMARLPMVGCDFPPLRSFKEEYGIIHLFDPEDPNSIADAVNECISDKSVYSQAKRQTETVNTKYNWENECMKLIEIYQGIGS